MDEVNVVVIAPILGRDLSFVSDVDPRVRVFDANFAAQGRRAGPGGSVAADPGLLDDMLAQAEVLLVGYPVPGGLAACCPRLAWAHHTQAGVSNLAGTDLWASAVTLTSSRGAMAATAIAEYALAAAAHFARGLHEATRRRPPGSSPARAMRCSPCAGRRWGSSALAASARRWPGCRARPACG